MLNDMHEEFASILTLPVLVIAGLVVFAALTWALWIDTRIPPRN